MKLTNGQREWLWMLLTAALVVLLAFAALELQSSRAAALAAVQNLAECRELASEISKLRGRPSQITLQAQSGAELARQIESAAQVAQVPNNCVVRIDPQPARRIGESPYKEQPANLELRAVTLKQLVQFLQTLQEGGAGLRTRSMRLIAPRQEATAPSDAETWMAEVTLTSMIFAPKNTPPR